MWIELPNLWIALANCFGIPAAHLLIAWGSTRLPSSVFRAIPNRPPTHDGKLYDRLFLVRRWKHLLPDAAPWLGGIAKGQLRSSDLAYLESFTAETRRGEFSHWLQWIAISTFVIWTPYPAALVILAWAALSNLPCIINLRFTRIRILHLLLRIQDRSPLP